MLPEPGVTCQKVMVSPRCVKKAVSGRQERRGRPCWKTAGPRGGNSAGPEITPDLELDPTLLRHPDRAPGQASGGVDVGRDVANPIDPGKGGSHVASITSARNELR